MPETRTVNDLVQECRKRAAEFRMPGGTGDVLNEAADVLEALRDMVVGTRPPDPALLELDAPTPAQQRDAVERAWTFEPPALIGRAQPDRRPEAVVCGDFKCPTGRADVAQCATCGAHRARHLV